MIDADRIDTWLPQTQCTRCGYPHCRAYAEAVASGAADINQCPPGGEATITALAALLERTPKPLDPAFGPTPLRTRADINEALCIGCKKCIDACPVDAIVGAAKLMHTIIAADCTGCELCLPVCPVDCINLVPVARTGTRWPAYTEPETTHWRALAERRRTRHVRPARRAAARTPAAPDAVRARIRAEIRAAVERVRQKRAGRS